MAPWVKRSEINWGRKSHRQETQQDVCSLHHANVYFVLSLVFDNICRQQTKKVD